MVTSSYQVFTIDHCLDAVNVEPSPLVHDLEDTDLAIKQAMQVSH